MITSEGRTGGDRATGRTGMVYGVGAYTIWGMAPLFWQLLNRTGALEILAMRIVWSMIYAVVVVSASTAQRRWTRLLTRRNVLLLAAAAALVSINWGV